MVTHKHHIIPRYMGGTDSPENLVELTVEEHAHAHRDLYVMEGRKEDWLAWKGLEGLIDKQDMVHQTSLIGGRNGNAKHVNRMNTDPVYNAKVRAAMRHPNKCAKNKKYPKSAEHAANISKAAKARPRVPCKHCGEGYTIQNLAKHEKFCA